MASRGASPPSVSPPAPAAAAGSSKRSQKQRGRIVYTQPTRPTPEQMMDPHWMNDTLARARQEGNGEIVLVHPPVGFSFPPSSSVVPSPHSYLFLSDNFYSPATKQDARDPTLAMYREKADAECSIEVQYAQWQRHRRLQEQCTRQLAQEKAAQLRGSIGARASERAAAAEAAARAEATARQRPKDARWTIPPVTPHSSLPQPVSSLYAALPPALQRLEDPLSIRAFIEAQRVKAIGYTSSPSFSSPNLADTIVLDEVPTAASNSGSAAAAAAPAAAAGGSTKKPSLASVDYVSYDTKETPSSVQLRRAIELAPTPDASGAEDTHIRYCKNAGSVVMIKKEQQTQQQRQKEERQSNGGAADAPTASSVSPFASHDPLHHLRSTLIHSRSPCNLLSIMAEEFERKRRRRRRRHEEGSAGEEEDDSEEEEGDEQDDASASAMRPHAPASAASAPDADDGSDDDVPLEDSAIETTGTGVLEPTLYCGVRGSMTSLHSENDQLSSFHQVSAGIKVWYSVASSQANNRKLLKLMRSLAWLGSFEPAEEEVEDASKARAHRQLGVEDRDYGLKAHMFFFHPKALLDLGMDVHITVQTPENSLVMTAGCYHQILNLTAVEGWSANFLPPCMVEVVQSVRVERDLGWQWNYQEGICLLAIAWRALMAGESESRQYRQQPPPKTERKGPARKKAKRTPEAEENGAAPNGALSQPTYPLLMRVACARVLEAILPKELDDRRFVSASGNATAGETSSGEAVPAAATSEAEPAPSQAGGRPSRKRRRSSKLRWSSPEDAPTVTAAAAAAPSPAAPALDPSQTDSTSILHLPLPVRRPPRSYPELCTFCQNLSFFSAVYASTGAAGAPAANGNGGSGPATSPVKPFAAEATAFHLCCTGCLVKYMKLDAKYSTAASSGASSSSSSSSSSSGNATSGKRKHVSTKSKPATAVGISGSGGGSSSGLTFSTAGALPSQSCKDALFHLVFRQSLERHAKWWRLAFLGVRVPADDIERGRSVCRALTNTEVDSTEEGEKEPCDSSFVADAAADAERILQPANGPSAHVPMEEDIDDFDPAPTTPAAAVSHHGRPIRSVTGHAPVRAKLKMAYV